jgi:hypothetical protein
MMPRSSTEVKIDEVKDEVAKSSEEYMDEE